mgnify:CR=1 FL=1|jgi:hypothetical protein
MARKVQKGPRGDLSKAKEAKATMQPKKCKGALVWDDKTGKCVIPENLRKVIAKERLKPVTKVLKNKKKGDK